MSERLDFVITSDRTMMTNHRGKEFLGFMTTAPSVIFPERIWLWICAPRMKCDERGFPWQAPYGMRKIEAALQDAGFKAAIVDPDYIDKYLGEAKAVLISHHDFFAFCPPSSEWWFLTRREPVNRKLFTKLMGRVSAWKKRNEKLKILVGGPAAWQWLFVPDLWKRWSVDCVIDGEAEKVVVEIAEKIINDEEIPRYVYIGPKDVPSIHEIPIIKHASINGLIEVMRGCPRGCKFCPVTLRPLRRYPLSMVEEVKVNVREGVEDGIIHSEDVLLYGSESVIPNPTAVLRLHELVKRYYRTIAWSHTSLAAVKVAEENFKLISKLREVICDEHQDYWGVQIGIETGSVELAEKIMPAKAAPYSIRMWPQVVEDGLTILHENNCIPACTLIIGLPGETVDDIYATMELLDRLKHLRFLVIPLFYVPMGLLASKSDWFRDVDLNEAHAELMLQCLRHSIRWAKVILNKYYMRGARYCLVRFLLNIFLSIAERYSKTLTPSKIVEVVKQHQVQGAVVSG